MPNIDEFKDIARGLLQNPENKARYNNRVLADKYYNGDWDLPESLAGLQWMRKRVVKIPFDSVEAGKAAYSTLEPNFGIRRPASKRKDIERYNNIENLLVYNFMRASKRHGGLVAAMLQNILLYGEGIASVTHIDAYLEKTVAMNPNKRRGINKFGDFIIDIPNTKDIRVRYSKIAGMDGVLDIKLQTVAEFENYWLDKAKPITDRKFKDDYKDKNYVCVYDYIDWENRAVWANFQATNTSISPGSVDGLKIMLEAHELPFLPWAARSTVDKTGFLDSIMPGAGDSAGAWDEANITESLMHSESIARASALRYAIKSLTGEYKIYYGTPDVHIDLKPGDEIIQLRPPEIDQALMILSDRTRADMQLVPDIVISGNAPAGSAFASINQLMQSGLAKFSSYREVAERLTEDIGCLMADWAKYLKKPLSSPIKGKKGVMSGKFELDIDTYDYDDLEIVVELRPDMPIDRMAQIQAASQGVTALGWTRNYANEQLGENDPEELEKQLKFQAFEDAEAQNELLLIQAEGQTKAQAVLKGRQEMLAMADDPQGAQLLDMAFQAWQQALAAPKGQGSAPAPQGEGTPPNPENTQGLDGVGGAGFDPNSGGVPPAVAIPGTGSQSQATGRDRQGAQVA